MRNSVVFIIGLFLHLYAQGGPNGSGREGDKVGIPDVNIRESDVMWSTTLWRIIDLREKINLPLYYPKEPTGELKSMWSAIDEGIRKGFLFPFKAQEGLKMVDDFRSEMSREAYLQSICNITQIQTYDEDGFEDSVINDTSFVASEDIKMYKIKEQWFIDKQRSILDVRIIGIAPMKEVKDPIDGMSLGYTEMFWLYFPWCRDYFATVPVFNRMNDAERLSLDDFFKKRMFTGLVVKESNVYDRYIGDYKSGVDALQEEFEIRNRIMNRIFDMWSY